MTLPPYARNMRQAATYWPATGSDQFGQPTYGAAVAILCRWQDRAVLFRDADGHERTSASIVYPDRALEPRGKLRLGTHTGAPTTDARTIGQVGTSPSLRQDRQLFKAWLV